MIVNFDQLFFIVSLFFINQTNKIYIYFLPYVPNTYVENLLFFFYFFNIFHS